MDLGVGNRLYYNKNHSNLITRAFTLTGLPSDDLQALFLGELTGSLIPEFCTDLALNGHSDQLFKITKIFLLPYRICFS